jgi:hypothetical protein
MSARREYSDRQRRSMAPEPGPWTGLVGLEFFREPEKRLKRNWSGQRFSTKVYGSFFSLRVWYCRRQEEATVLRRRVYKCRRCVHCPDNLRYVCLFVLLVYRRMQVVTNTNFLSDNIENISFHTRIFHEINWACRSFRLVDTNGIHTWLYMQTWHVELITRGTKDVIISRSYCCPAL